MTFPSEVRLAAWREEPVRFVYDVRLKGPRGPDNRLDGWQTDVFQVFPSVNRIAMKASKGPGKTFTLAGLILNFMATRENSIVIATSITGDNLRDGLWTELARWIAGDECLNAMFEWSAERIVCRESPSTWWASARSWPKSASSQQQADALAGPRADYALYVLDEVGGIPDAVMAAVEAGLATGIETKVIMAGNPTHREGPLYRACCTKEREKWYVAEITGDPDNPKRSQRVKREWALDMIEKYGRDSPYVQVNVFGNFPPASINALLGPDDVSRSMLRAPKPPDYQWSQRRLGVDTARFGDDRTVLFPRQGCIAWKPIVLRDFDSAQIAGRILAMHKAEPFDRVSVDAGGPNAGGVIDALRQSGVTYSEVHSADTRTPEPEYHNMRAVMHFRAREWVLGHGALPNDPDVAREAVVPTYSLQLNSGRIRVVEKQILKDELGESPDIWDAFCLTFDVPDQPRRGNLPGFAKRPVRVLTDS